MNLVLDFGNTLIKAAFFEKSTLLKESVFKSTGELINSAWLKEQYKNVIISSVTQQHPEVQKHLKPNANLLIFDHKTPIPLKNLYLTPLTLGSDRILSSIGSFVLYPNQNVLTIDAGTCIKYNFVNQNNEFLGGAISPGIPMRLKAMHNFTSALPLIEPEEKFSSLIGNDTKSSLLSGAQLGAVAEVDGTINLYKSIYPNLQVVLCGGDSLYLSEQLKNPFFANQNNLLLGLNTVLHFNFEN